jgi:hypothetical protein
VVEVAKVPEVTSIAYTNSLISQVSIDTHDTSIP